MEPTVSQILKTVGLYGVRFQYGHCDLVLDRLMTTQTDEFRAVRAAAYGISRSWSTGRLSPSVVLSWLGVSRRRKAMLAEITTMKKISFAGHTLQLENGNLSVERQTIDTTKPGDYGADPLGDGTFKMVPSGDIVSFEERNRRLAR